VTYLEDIAFVKPSTLVDMDGIHFNPKDYEELYGYSEIGVEAYVQQIVILGKTYAVHAAVGEDRFYAWEIFQGNVSHREVVSFINNILAPVLPRDAFMILDNASNQKHHSVPEALETCLHGRYMYVSPYSPELKPIQRAFSMVRCWIRSRELDIHNDQDALDLVNRAFQEYAVEGPLGHHCHKLFDLYRVNHQIFQEDLNK
jgi:hypothetical protein